MLFFNSLLVLTEMQALQEAVSGSKNKQSQ
jgi:hypothetical protein